MCKLLVLAAALAILTPVNAQSDAKSPDNGSHGQPSQQTAQAPPSVSQPDIALHAQKKSGDDEPKGSHGLFDYLGVVLTIVIAGATVVQARVAWWQARVYERQYQVMSDALVASNRSAEAAAKGVAAIEKLERPFLMIEVRGEPPSQIWMVNKGKVPAQIIWHNPAGTLRLFTADAIEQLPADFPYGFGYYEPKSEDFNVPWMAPGDERELCGFDWGVIQMLDEETVKQYQTGHMQALFLSAIKYRGMLSDTIFESRWCFRWWGKNHGLKLSGPYGYNKYT